MQPAKNILTVFLLAAFSLPLVLPVFLQINQLHVQWEMNEAMEQQELMQVKVKTSSLQWIRNGKECLINGEMFDVKSSSVVNDETLLTGLFDKKETQIKKNIEEQTKDQQDTNKWKQLVKLYSAFQVSSGPVNLEIPAYFISLRPSLFQSSFYLQPHIRSFTPPPEMA